MYLYANVRTRYSLLTCICDMLTFQGFVFCRALEDIADISIAGKYLSVRRGDINILQYFVIKDYIVDGRMLLM